MKKLNRRSFLEQTSKTALGIAATTIGLKASETSAKPTPRPPSSNKKLPNILHIVVHDLGNHIACLGHTDVKTPRLDQLAKEGVLFTNHFCNSTPCSPARGCAMTGRYPHSNGLTALAHMGIALPESELTIVDYLNDAGYETCNIGVQHERRSQKQNRYKQNKNELDLYIREVAPTAIDFLKNNTSIDTPFYLNVGTFDVHRPWDKRLVRDKSPQQYHFTEGFTECIPFQAQYKADEIKLPGFLPDIPFFRNELKDFYGVITHMDEQVGLILDALKKSGLGENTLVIFTTDHGIDFARAKGTLYDTGMTTAMIMRWPGHFKAGLNFSHQTQHVDLAPTILDLLGLPIPPAIQGRSYAPFLLGKSYQPNEYIFTERNFFGDFDPMRAVRTPRYKLIRNYSERCRMMYPWEFKKEGPITQLYVGPEARPYEELYDLKEDPNEFKNIASNPESAPILKDLRAQMNRWQDETADFMRGGYAFCHFPAMDKRFLPEAASEKH